jgi:hypothetical protein
LGKQRGIKDIGRQSIVPISRLRAWTRPRRLQLYKMCQYPAPHHNMNPKYLHWKACTIFSILLAIQIRPSCLISAPSPNYKSYKGPPSFPSPPLALFPGVCPNPRPPTSQALSLSLNLSFNTIHSIFTYVLVRVFDSFSSSSPAQTTPPS